MKNDTLSPFQYHIQNTLSLLITFAAIIVSTYLESSSDSTWVKLPIWVTGIITVILFFRYKDLEENEKYHNIATKGTSMAFWLFFSIFITFNSLMAIPNMVNEICSYPVFVGNYVLFQSVIILLIRELTIIKLCKKNDIL